MNLDVGLVPIGSGATRLGSAFVGRRQRRRDRYAQDCKRPLHRKLAPRDDKSIPAKD
jgi:hypothetical protein